MTTGSTHSTATASAASRNGHERAPRGAVRPRAGTGAVVGSGGRVVGVAVT
jgi:hypothetical protein